MEKNILLVDDEPDILDAIVKKMISDAQGEYYPLVAQDGYEAVELLKKNLIAAVVLDLNMRNLDGLNVCQTMMKDSRMKMIPIIISSGDIDDETQSQLTALGIKNFLKKPYSMDSLLKLLKKVVSD